METIPENLNWLNRIAKAHLLGMGVRPDPATLYMLQLMQWGLKREWYQGDPAVRDTLLKTVESLKTQAPEAALQMVLKSSQPQAEQRHPNLRADADDLANQLLKFLAEELLASQA